MAKWVDLAPATPPQQLLTETEKALKNEGRDPDFELGQVENLNYGWQQLASEILFSTDCAICGENQLPAYVYKQVGGDIAGAEKLAAGRLVAAFGNALEVVGTSLTTFGLSEKGSPAIFAFGTTLDVLGFMTRSNVTNRNGSKWFLMLSQKTDELGAYTKAIEAALINSGVAEEEVGSLSMLPRDIYRAELTSFYTSRMRMSLRPAGSALAMAVNGDYLTASVISGLGFLSFPIGNRFHKEADKYRQAQMRAGRSAKHAHYLREIHDAHVSMTDRINFISTLPKILFAFKYLRNTGGNMLAALSGLSYSLEGLSDLLSFQRAREESRRSVEIATYFINTISNRPFIVTHERWKEHVDENGIVELDAFFETGLVVRNFNESHAFI